MRSSRPGSREHLVDQIRGRPPKAQPADHRFTRRRAASSARDERATRFLRRSLKSFVLAAVLSLLFASLAWAGDSSGSATADRRRRGREGHEPAKCRRDRGRVGSRQDRTQPLLPDLRRRPRVLHADGLRHGRDRLLPFQERRARDHDQLRHLRDRRRQLLGRGLRPRVRRSRHAHEPRRHAVALRPHRSRPRLGHLRPSGLLPLGSQLRRRRSWPSSSSSCVHGHRRDDPHGGDGRTLEVLGLRRLRLLHGRPRLPNLRQLGVGRRLAQRPGAQPRPWPRRPRLRRLRSRCTPSAAAPPSPEPSCSGRASASSARTGARA